MRTPFWKAGDALVTLLCMHMGDSDRIPSGSSRASFSPQNRFSTKKTFASSAFYVPGVHPTVREQMELARAISRSLSDERNHTSRGQNMYVNRKKRSVKWVHEGRGQCRVR
ncbi:hypothetical protein EVAR_29159_1 [Eumeta japonica]|uniref:Uncharacterized protein n=1 Tax=Eumeta variegata TaxID=151549 RepID=A0A4C1VBM6_EUMVA|nr:hypothetical protein EVAR_29159_1 [Eumeta japonica]